jgi:hypothetical protein
LTIEEEPAVRLTLEDSHALFAKKKVVAIVQNCDEENSSCAVRKKAFQKWNILLDVLVHPRKSF